MTPSVLAVKAAAVWVIPAFSPRKEVSPIPCSDLPGAHLHLLDDALAYFVTVTLFSPHQNPILPHHGAGEVNGISQG